MKRAEGATMRFILAGIGVAAFISALTTTMLTYGDIADAQAALGWLQTPAGIVTALVGAPVFAVLILRAQRGRQV